MLLLTISVPLLICSRVLGPPSEGSREEGDDVCGLEAAAANLEACEEVADRHLFIEGGLLL